jgi:DNA-binding NtrC family response regulator
MKVAERVGKAEEVRADIRLMAASPLDDENFVARVLGRELGLP